ncbi:MAG TPA: acetylornithine deacetylase [Alphaproteobacteria bacterium]|nr:acetylornithine deacetylase [Alphaproteobacteria bacterium]
MTVRALSSRDMIERLVAFDTTSAKSNLSLIAHVADYLAGYGVTAHLTHNEDGTKANLYATIGPDNAGGVVLSGHTDVVPVLGQNWSSDPFAMVERDGKLFGRGTADMKSFIAVALALVPEMIGVQLETPIHFALSYDEEVGCFGVGRMIDHIRKSGLLPRLVIVGEPTGMKVANAHKGAYVFHTRIVGREGHSSAPHRGASAVLAAAEMVRFLAALSDELALRAPRPGTPDGDFDPPHTTISIGRIEGGTAFNIIPKECALLWECRPLPGTDDGREILRRFEEHAARHVAPALRDKAADGGVFTEIGVSCPPLTPDRHSPAEALALALSGENATRVVAFGSEAGLFQEAGIPAVLCGPGNITQAHQADEFIAIEQITACERFLRRLIRHCAA